MTAPASPLRAFHASNLLTYASLVAGVGAIAFAARGNRSAAGALIAMSVVADTFDGRFAGLFRRTAMQRQVGVQLDSLSDAIAFGIAPAVCMAALRVDWWSRLGSWRHLLASGLSSRMRPARLPVSRSTTSRTSRQKASSAYRCRWPP